MPLFSSSDFTRLQLVLCSWASFSTVKTLVFPSPWHSVCCHKNLWTRAGPWGAQGTAHICQHCRGGGRSCTEISSLQDQQNVQDLYNSISSAHSAQRVRRVFVPEICCWDCILPGCFWALTLKMTTFLRQYGLKNNSWQLPRPMHFLVYILFY